MDTLVDKPLYYRINKFEVYFKEEFSQELISCGYLPHKYLTKEQAEMKIKTLDSKYMYSVVGIYWFDLVTIEE